MKKNKLLRNLLLLAIAFSIVFSFFGKSNSSNVLDDLAYIMAIAVDVGNNNTYKISFQISTIYSSSEDSSNSGSSSDSSSGSTSPSYNLHTVECDSIDSGINIVNTYVDKSIDFSHCKLLLISEDLARQGISPIIYSLINKIEITPDCNLIVTKIAKDEFSSKDIPSLEELLPKFYDITSNTKIESGYTTNITLSDFYFRLNCSSCEPTAILGNVYNSRNSSDNNADSSVGIDNFAGDVTSTSDNPIIEILGLAAFKNDRLVGTLSGIETVCHFLLTNKLDSCSISVPNTLENNSTINMSISVSHRPKINVYISGSPYVTVDISLNAKILSFNNSINNLNTNISSDILNQIEYSAQQYLAEQLTQYLYKTSTEWNSDISGIGMFARKRFSTLQEWNNYNWLSTYSSSVFNVNVDLSIQSGYLLTNE